MDIEYTDLRDSALEELKKHMDSLDPSKGKKLAYWVKDYVTFLRQESTFQPDKLIRYKRGAIIKAHLGFRVGSEEGGLHYAIVMDANNSIHSPIVTVIPLTSIKPGFDSSKLPRSNVNLGSEIYSLLDDTLSHELNDAEEKLRIHAAEWEISKANGGITREQKLQMQELREQARYCRRMLDECARMKQGSIALVGQITTISKIRIYNPRYSRDALSKIRISSSTLNALDQKVQELFGPKQTSEKTGKI